MLKAVLFDLDGTLVNTDPIHFKTWQNALSSFDMEIDRVFYNSRISGRLNPQIVADILPQLSLEEGQKVADYKEALFREIAQELKPLSGVLEILAWTQKQQLNHILVTNAPRENVDFMLKVLDLKEVFPQVVLAEECERGKPDPLPYLTALELLEVSAEESIAFEDSPSGIRSSVGAKIETIGIASTHPPEELKAVGAKIVVEDFTHPSVLSHLQSRCGYGG